MCTAISFSGEIPLFGRNLDLDHSYKEEVAVMPRNCPFPFLRVEEKAHHYAYMGMAAVFRDVPLFYDALNEKGLGVAGLLFPKEGGYLAPSSEKENLCSFEWIPYVMERFSSVEEVRAMLPHIQLTPDRFLPELPVAPLHFLLSDGKENLVIEPTKEGLHSYSCPQGVLTNSPDFPFQQEFLTRFLSCTPREPENRFSKALTLRPSSFGYGGIGLPGDLSSSSRFVRGAFYRENAVKSKERIPLVSQFFHVLSSVMQVEGGAKGEKGWEKTVYSCCMDLKKGCYFYKTYGNSRITCLDIRRANLNGKSPFFHTLLQNEDIFTVLNFFPRFIP